MTELDRESIEALWQWARKNGYKLPLHDIKALCDMALRTHDAEQRAQCLDEECETHAEDYRQERKRAQRAEAECERLRKALHRVLHDDDEWPEHIASEALATEQTDPADTATQAMGQIDEIQRNMDVLHAPEQGCEYSIRCVICDAIVTPEDGGLCNKHKYDEQAHGDALLCDLDNITDSEAQGSPEYERIRRHLTASVVPYVPESIRKLPERLREEGEAYTATDPADCEYAAWSAGDPYLVSMTMNARDFEEISPVKYRQGSSWIRHDGVECPVHPLDIVETVFHDGSGSIHPADFWVWCDGIGPETYKIIKDEDGIPYCSNEGLEPWAEYVATDEDGEVDQFEEKPKTDEEMWWPFDGLVKAAPSRYSNTFQHWTETLRRVWRK